MAKSTINRQQLFLEFLSVVFAVLLALLLNSWREQAATSRSLHKVKLTIQKEMTSNTQEVSRVLTYRRGLLKELNQGTHLIMAESVSNFPVDVTNDGAFEKFLIETMPFSQSTPIDRLEIKRLADDRVLVLNDRNLRLVVENDSIKLYGEGNIQLRTADISNRSWEIAQATGMLVEMNLELVDALNKSYNLHNRYFFTSDKAIEMIYKSEPGIRSVMEDMVNLEHQIIKADSVVLTMLPDIH